MPTRQRAPPLPICPRISESKGRTCFDILGTIDPWSSRSWTGEVVLTARVTSLGIVGHIDIQVWTRALLVILQLAARIIALLEFTIVEPIAVGLRARWTPEPILFTASRLRRAILFSRAQRKLTCIIINDKRQDMQENRGEHQHQTSE